MSDSATPFSGNRNQRRRTPRPPPPISTNDFERAALRHLDRYPCSSAGLRAVLERRAQRSHAHHGGDPAEAEALIDATLSRMHEQGLLDDRRYGKALARRLRTRGGSLRRIAVRLHEKGIASPLRAEVLKEAGGDEAELAAARTYARRRGLGVHRRGPHPGFLAPMEPFQKGPIQKGESQEGESQENAEAQRHQRQRDLAALARAGFAFAQAIQALDSD